ncbi:hypothetical protein [Oscillibacter sp.]|uniref:hypothetical protein n=1 Tax=Oscillibacter sp. TaxID=1945593 RepID=UPI0037C61A37
MVGKILALSLVLAGTEYAYWTHTLNVTTKTARDKANNKDAKNQNPLAGISFDFA